MQGYSLTWPANYFLRQMGQGNIRELHVFGILPQWINFLTKEHCTFPIFNLSCIPKLIQRHYYKFSKIEKNGIIIRIIFFFWKIICLQLIVEEKIRKYQLNSGGVVSANQGCRQRSNRLQGLNEDKGFFSKFILVTRQREGWEKKLCSIIQLHLQRHLTTVYNILL